MLKYVGVLTQTGYVSGPVSMLQKPSSRIVYRLPLTIYLWVEKPRSHPERLLRCEQGLQGLREN